MLSKRLGSASIIRGWYKNARNPDGKPPSRLSLSSLPHSEGRGINTEEGGECRLGYAERLPAVDQSMRHCVSPYEWVKSKKFHYSRKTIDAWQPMSVFPIAHRRYVAAN